jgi:hypothetical protein
MSTQAASPIAAIARRTGWSGAPCREPHVVGAQPAMTAADQNPEPEPRVGPEVQLAACARAADGPDQLVHRGRSARRRPARSRAGRPATTRRWRPGARHRTPHRPGPTRDGRTASESKRCLRLTGKGWVRGRHPPRPGGPLSQSRHPNRPPHRWMQRSGLALAQPWPQQPARPVSQASGTGHGGSSLAVSSSARRLARGSSPSPNSASWKPRTSPPPAAHRWRSSSISSWPSL